MKFLRPGENYCQILYLSKKVQIRREIQWYIKIILSINVLRIKIIFIDYKKKVLYRGQPTRCYKNAHTRQALDLQRKKGVRQSCSIQPICFHLKQTLKNKFKNEIHFCISHLKMYYFKKCSYTPEKSLIHILIRKIKMRRKRINSKKYLIYV